ncbi:MAG: hypothetical protein ACI3YE_08620 [Candidatus Avispirillum sp.]
MKICMKKVLAVVLPLLIFLLASCNSVVQVDEDHREASETVSLSEDGTGYVSGVGDETVKEADYYRLIRSGHMYYCCFLDKNSEVVKTEGPVPKEPEIIDAGDGLLRYTYQAGTGIGALWGYYYDTDSGEFSEKFTCIFDECGGRVAFAKKDRVIIRDIFDDSGYYTEISDFIYPFSPTAEVFSDVEFSDDGSSVTITYLTGDGYKNVSEEFGL